jgi:hypothetical protein
MLSIDNSEAKQKNFPAFETVDLTGKTWTEDDLQKEKTLAIVMHLGCPGAMPLLNDLDSLKRVNEELRALIFCQNTRDQLDAFFSMKDSNWQKIRDYYGVRKNLNLVFLPECDEPFLKNGEVVITQQCRGISKQLKTKSSPAIFLVHEGTIKKKQEGYIAKAITEERMTWLENFTN